MGNKDLGKITGHQLPRIETLNQHVKNLQKHHSLRHACMICVAGKSTVKRFDILGRTDIGLQFMQHLDYLATQNAFTYDSSNRLRQQIYCPFQYSRSLRDDVHFKY